MDMRTWTIVVAIATLFSAVQVCSAGGSSAGPAATDGSSVSNELIVCGGDEVYILDLSQRENGKPKKVWSWRAAGRPELTKDLFPLGWEFNDSTECKPVDGGSKVLIACDTQGIALVDRATGRALFYANVESAHSAEMLPGNRVAVAGSGYQGTATPRNADSLTVFDAVGPGKEVCRVELPYGHGVVWDSGRQMLWALSGGDIRAYRLWRWESDEPSLEMVLKVRLPEGGGHDLSPVPGSPLMMVTTGNHCWFFDPDTREFRLHPALGEMRGVKSISVNAATQQIAYVQSEGGNWWSERVNLLSPEDMLHRPGEHVYKARWNRAAR